MKYLAFIVAFAFMTTPAWAADAVADGGSSGAPAFAAPVPNDQSTLELVWDSGTRSWSIAWYTGSDTWVGNDFDASTLKTSYAKILKYKYYTRGAWPNQVWDGMRFAFYSFKGGVPGSMLWPTSGNPYFFKPSGGIQAHIWVEFNVDWTCPSVKFVAAQEQFYNYPNCDPFSVDNNTTFVGHSWKYEGGSWAPYIAGGVSEPYRNLMIRIWVETGQEFPGVAPSSIGRVKALYY
ncbi:MAG: hypothetical protein V3W11_11625 [bacterium]